MSKTTTKPQVTAVAAAAATAAAATPAPAAAVAAPAEAPTTPAIPRGYWEAADGSLVPESKVKDLDKARDQVVRELATAAQDLAMGLETFRRLALSEIEQFVDLSATQYGVQMRGAAGKGNVTLTSFDGRFKVERQVADRIAFDERLQVAKAAIDECLHRWGKGANENYQVIVNDTFAVDKAGRVSVAKVLDLRRHKIDDPAWLTAMDIVSDSVTRVGSAVYVRFYKRDDATGKYLPIPLSMSAA